MTFEELVAEGHRLEKTCLYLTDEPNEDGIVGYWGGDGPSGLSKGHGWIVDSQRWKHWITVDCHWLNEQGARVDGIISAYENTGDPEESEFHEEGAAIYQYRSSLQEVKIEGQPLFGVESNSFPPIQAVCLYGSEKVEDWLKEQGLKRTDYDSLRGEIVSQYERYWLERSPLLNEDYVAVMGGWHTQWPEDDFYMPKEMELVVWTLRDAEPWLEVWARMPNFRVKLRIT